MKFSHFILLVPIIGLTISGINNVSQLVDNDSHLKSIEVNENTSYTYVSDINDNKVLNVVLKPVLTIGNTLGSVASFTYDVISKSIEVINKVFSFGDVLTNCFTGKHRFLCALRMWLNHDPCSCGASINNLSNLYYLDRKDYSYAY